MTRMLAGPGLPKAVLLDMDGTLVDTEPLWWRAVAEGAGSLGWVLGPDDAGDVVGRPAGHTADYLTRRTGSRRPTADVAAQLEAGFLLLVGVEPPVLPGALELLLLLRRTGIPAAVVSASSRSVVDVVLAALGADLFATSVAAGETPRTKPAPDPYLAAARILGLHPHECLAVEDSPTGLASAEAAGVPVVLVPSTEASLDGPGRTRVSSLADADLDLLARAFSAPR